MAQVEIVPFLYSKEASMENKIRICVDAMGGDNAPGQIVKGALEALEDDGRLHILLAGPFDRIKKELDGYAGSMDRLEIIDAPEIIGTDEVPTTAIRNKKNSSIVMGLNLVKENKAQAFVSAGNTGALLAGATVIIGRIKGIDRPALATLLPNARNYSLMIDSGANADVKPVYLVQFAKMGSVYMENIANRPNPKVGLINIGSEKEKGNALTKEAYGLLEEAGINFTGNIEARDIPFGKADVIVCDGFVGNVILKYSEGFAEGILSMIKEELMAGTMSKIGGMLCKNSFSNLKKRFDHSEVGGAAFLGLKALVVKAHGSANAKAIRGAIRQCSSFIEQDIVNKIEESLK